MTKKLEQCSCGSYHEDGYNSMEFLRAHDENEYEAGILVERLRVLQLIDDFLENPDVGNTPHSLREKVQI